MRNNRLNRYSITLVVLFYVIMVSICYTTGTVSVETLHAKYLFLFPLGILVAIVAMSSGISGSNFWIPINVIVLNIEPRISFWLALFAMLFGFGSGVIKHFQQKTINIRLAGRYLLMAIPGALIGTAILPYVQTSFMLIGFGIFVALYGLRLLFIKRAFMPDNEKITLSIAFIGGILKGIIATGLGKLLLPRLINHKGVSHPEAVGTVVTVVFLTNIVAVFSILRHDVFYASLLNNWEELFSIMIFVAPAVIIGGQIGPKIPNCISKEMLIKYVGSLLLIVSFFMIRRGLLIYG